MNFNWNDWFEGKEFSTDWASGNFENWASVFALIKNKRIEILELGSWEGRSAVFFAEFFPFSNINCVDTFGGGSEHLGNSTFKEQIPHIERRFDKNTSQYGVRISKYKNTTFESLSLMVQRNDRYELIYIDASHERDDVMIDTLLAWKLLSMGGYMMWDDYGGGASVKPAVDKFLDWHKDEYEIIHAGYQVVIKRVK